MKKILSIFLAVTLMVSTFTLTADAADISDTSMLRLPVKVSYRQDDARNMVNSINSFRKSADAWYWNEDNETKTICSGLQDLTYDYGLEQVAMQRAAEIAVCFAHTRPNETKCWTAFPDGLSIEAENLAYGQNSADKVFVAWREDDYDYSRQGHRRNMLNGQFKAVGIGHCVVNGTNYWVQEFADKVISATKTNVGTGETTVYVDALRSSMKSSALVTPYEDEIYDWIQVKYGGYEVVSDLKERITFRFKDDIRDRDTYIDIKGNYTTDDANIASISGNYILGNNVGTTYINVDSLCTGAKLKKEIRVVPARLTNTDISLEKTTFDYTGSAIKPAVTVTHNGRTLAEGVDYTLSYSHNIHPGTAYVTITGRGNYTGSFSSSFKINSKSQKKETADKKQPATTISKLKSGKKSITITWKQQTADTKGYEIQYATDKKFTKDAKTIKVNKSKTTSKTIKKLKSGKKYFVRIRTYNKKSGKKVYSSWSKVKSIKVK